MHTPQPAGNDSVHDPSRRFHIAVWISLIAIAALLRILHLWCVEKHPFVGLPGVMPDAAYNHEWAVNAPPARIASAPHAYYVSPLYVELLRGLYSVVGPQPVVARVLQLALGCLTPILLYRVAMRLAGPVVAVLTGLLTAIFPVFIFYEATLTKESILPFTTALTLDLLTSAASTQRKSARPFFGAGLACGMLCLLRPNLLIFVIIVFMILLCSGRSTSAGARLRIASTWAIGAAVAIMPFTIRNWMVARDWVLMNTNGGFSFYAGNVRGSDAYYRGLRGISGRIREEQADTRRIAENALGRELRDSEVSRYWFTRGWEEIRFDYRDCLRRAWRKFLFAANDLEVPNAEHYYYARSWSYTLRLSLPGFGMILPWAILGAFVYRVARPTSTFLTIFAACVLAGLLVFYVSDRYRMPLSVAAIPLAACGMRWFVSAIRQRMTRAVVWATMLVACGYALASLPLAPDLRTDFSMPLINAANYFLETARPREAWSILAEVANSGWERVEASEAGGKCLLALGDLDAAGAAIDKAIAQDPGRFQSYFLRGQLDLARGRTTAAVSDFQKVLELNPDSGEAHYYLGALYRRQDRTAEARRELGLALKCQPDLIPVYIELSRLEAALGHRETARRILEQAAQRAPEDTRIRDELAAP